MASQNLSSSMDIPSSVEPETQWAEPSPASLEVEASEAGLSEDPGIASIEALQGTLLETKSFAPRKGTNLSQRLLLTLLPTTLIPLVIAGFLGFQAEKQRAQGEALTLLEEESFLAANVASIFVEDGFQTTAVIAVNPDVRQALKESTQKAEAEGLAQRSIGDLEAAFAATKLLNNNLGLNEYLADVAKVEDFSDIFFTERLGFNVAYSTPTPDFAQQDERWWQTAKQEGQHIGPPELERTSNQMGVSLSRAISDPKTGEFMGVVKALVPTEPMDKQIATSIKSSAVGASQAVQVVDAQTGIPFNRIEPDGVSSGGTEIIGGSTIAGLAFALQEELKQEGATAEQHQATLVQNLNLASLQLQILEAAEGQKILTALTEIGTKTYSLTTVPGTNWVTIASVDVADVESAGNELIRVFATTTVLLGLAAAAVLLVLARQLAAPLQSLTRTAESATAGDLDVRANLEGTVETQTLGQVFNTLLNQIQTLLSQQKAAAEKQQQLREHLEQDITALMEDIGDAADGDLRVRAKLSEGDVGVVADLFNAIIENLRLTTIKVKSSTGQVTQSLSVNEAAIRDLADQAIAEAQSLKETLEAVEDISGSIQEVAANAGQASRLTKDTYASVQVGTQSMDQTVESILGLRTTVGETAKKIKRLGESAQKISQAVGLIDEIALKTNLLAVNASVEAARAGEFGQGFTAVAEQVGSLAEQSSAATKEIAQIVAAIQTETQEVVEAIETGTAQVVDSTKLVESTKQRLSEVLAKSQQINQLMQKISASATYQTESSAAVTELVQQVAQESERRSTSSKQMAQAIQSTAQVARELEASVEQFKLDEAQGLDSLDSSDSFQS